MKKEITKTELRKNIFHCNEHIHIGFFVEDEPYFSIITKDEIREHINDHFERFNYFTNEDTVAIDIFINKDIPGILKEELQTNGIEVFYKGKQLV